MIMEIISYIRSLLPGSKLKRKRSALDDLESPINSKFRKLNTQISTPEEDWLSNSSTNSIHRPRKNYMDSSDIILKPSWMKPLINSIVIDDDEDIENKKIRMRVTSTPNVSKSKENGFDDLSFKKYKESIKRPSFYEAEKLDDSSSLLSHKIKPNKNFLINNFKDSTSKFIPSFKKNSGFATALEYTYRLDEKKKYEELISKNQNRYVSNYDSFTEYSTPVGKILPITRARKITSIIKNMKPTDTLDLTNGDSFKLKHQKLTTKDTIMKVLNGMDNDVMVIKDSDSDVEVLPNPPSPKPDIKIERINSLKTAVHSSQPEHDSWISDRIQKHAEALAKKERALALTTAELNQLREINNDLRSKQLEDRVKRCLHLKDLVLPIEIKVKLPKLTSDQEAMVNHAFDRNKSGSAVLSSKFSLNITRRDMVTLSGLNWLNDEVINFYMNLIIERGKLDKYPNAYAFNTFFYPKLLKDGHSSIRRWTRRIDLFSHDLICVPIHLGMHWCMAIIDFASKMIIYYDSMGKPNYTCTDALLRYLQEEHLDKKKCSYDTSDWKLVCPKEIPQQMNGSDCGMFSCTFAEFKSRNAPFDFSQEDMPYLRRKMVVEIMTGQLLIQ